MVVYSMKSLEGAAQPSLPKIRKMAYECANTLATERSKTMRLSSLIWLVATVSVSLVAFVAALSIGPMSISWVAALSALLGHAPDALSELTVWTLRLPRSLMAVCVGAGLGLAGACMQGVLRNPLAEPGLAGVSSGAAVGAAAVLTLNWGWQPQAFWLPIMAFMGASLATYFVITLANVNAGSNPLEKSQVAARVLLAGIALNAFVTAILGLASYWADDASLRNLTFWTLGSVARANWSNLAVVCVAVLLPSLWLLRRDRVFNALMLGEAEASYLGVRVKQFQRKVLLCVALMVGVATAFCGMIGFIGLVAPHLVRLVFGPNYQRILIMSPVVGALLLLVSDVIARVVVAPAELPIGIVTALLGTPFFVWLQLRSRVL